MNGDTAIVLCTVIGTAIAVVTLTLGVRAQSRRQAADDARDKQDVYNRGLVDGKNSRDDELRQMKFERDDARHERDANGRRAEEWERRYMDLRDRRDT